MKQSQHRALLRAARRSERKEYVFVEEFVNSGSWNLPPFTEPPVMDDAALGRAIGLSSKFWPADKHENDRRGPLVRPRLMRVRFPRQTFRMLLDAPRSARTGPVAVPSALHTPDDLPDPGCLVIFAKYPPEWYTKKRGRKMP